MFGRMPIRWLPVWLTAVLLLIVVASGSFDLYKRQTLVTEQVRAALLHDLSHLTRMAEQGLGMQQGLLAADIAQAASDQRTAAIVVIDDAGRVITAHRSAWRGRPVKEVLPDFDLGWWQGIGRSRLPQLRTTGDGMRMEAIQTFQLPADADELSRRRSGTVFIAYDLSYDRDVARHRLITSEAPKLATMLLVFGLLSWWLQRQVARPVIRLAQTVDALRDGDQTVRAEVCGPAEIAALARNFNAMAEAIQLSQSQLKASESRLHITLQSIGDGLISTDAQGRIERMNPAAEALTGWSQDEARQRPIDEVFVIRHALTGEPMEIPVDRVLREGEVVALANHTVLMARDGSQRHIADSAALIRDEGGRIEGVVLVFHDVSEQYRLRQALLDSERHFRTLANSGMALIWTSRADGSCDWFNETWLKFTGRRMEEELGDGWATGVHADDLERVIATYRDALARQASFSMEYRLRHASGEYRWIIDHGSPYYDESGHFQGYMGLCLDITEAKRAEAEIQRLAYHDDLTGLPNRALFLDRLGQALSAGRRGGHCGAVIFIDLDHFKRVNDVHGHAVGDALLEEVAHRLSHYLRDTDTVARLGGDEFVVLLPELAQTVEDAAAMAMTVAEKLRAALTMPIAIGTQEFNIGASLGITVFPKDDEGVEDLVREADVAMYRAKEKGRNQVIYFEPALQAAVTQRYVMEQALRDAIRNETLALHLQSQVDADGRIVGAEALLRWHHPTLGHVPPARFIPLAEETGMVVPLGEWVLRESCRLITRLVETGHNLRISINVSPRQFREPDFVQRVRRILSETGADPTHLIFEITENLLVEQPHEAVACMTELANLGLRFAIDDFGTGYSSLAYLKRLPLFELKIDKGFVQDVPQDANDVALVETILSMASHLHLAVVAEGVETSEQLAFLVSRGCDRFQGYYWQYPLPLEVWIESLASGRTLRPTE